jgi:hypothetical protein
MRPDGEDKYFTGTAARSATRYLVTMEVGGLTGVVASVLGKDPPDLRFWSRRRRFCDSRGRCS